MIEIYCLLLGHDVSSSFRQRIIEGGVDCLILIFYFMSNVDLSEKKSKLISIEVQLFLSKLYCQKQKKTSISYTLVGSMES